jgi:hypothetical protein
MSNYTLKNKLSARQANANVGYCNSWLEVENNSGYPLFANASYITNFDDIKINRGQSLGRFNNRLSEEWNEVLFKLDKIMLSYIQDERFETVQIKKKCDNGVLIETETQWDELGNLILNNSDI